MQHQVRALALGIFLTAMTAATLLIGAPEAPTQTLPRGYPVSIGMVSTLFRDTPEPLVQAMMRPFAMLLQTQTGMAGLMVQGGDASHLGDLLSENKVQLAVFHGLEFAWARQNHPELRPLLVAINQHHHLRAYLITRQGSELSQWSDLRGKKVALPRHSREHCRVFLERHCLTKGQTAEPVFSSLTTPATPEDALDDVVDRTVSAAVIDGVALDCYRRRKPERYHRLQVMKASEVFPAAVVAYVPGTLDDDALRRFQDGMLQANTNPLGRQFLTLWKLTAFQLVPTDYEQTLSDIVKAYPAHAAAARLETN